MHEFTHNCQAVFAHLRDGVVKQVGADLLNESRDQGIGTTNAGVGFKGYLTTSLLLHAAYSPFRVVKPELACHPRDASLGHVVGVIHTHLRQYGAAVFAELIDRDPERIHTRCG